MHMCDTFYVLRYQNSFLISIEKGFFFFLWEIMHKMVLFGKLLVIFFGFVFGGNKRKWSDNISDYISVSVGMFIDFVGVGSIRRVLFQSNDIRTHKNQVFFIRLPVTLEENKFFDVEMKFDYHMSNMDDRDGIEFENRLARNCYIRHFNDVEYQYTFRCNYDKTYKLYSVAFEVRQSILIHRSISFIFIPENHYKSMHELKVFMDILRAKSYDITGYTIYTEWDIFIRDDDLDRLDTNNLYSNALHAIHLMKCLELYRQGFGVNSGIRIAQRIRIGNQAGIDEGGLIRSFYSKMLSAFAKVLFRDNIFNENIYELFHHRSTQLKIAYACGRILSIYIYLRYESEKFDDVLITKDDIPPIILDMILNRFEFKAKQDDNMFLKQYNLMEEYGTISRTSELMRKYLKNRYTITDQDSVGIATGNLMIDQLNDANIDVNGSIFNGDMINIDELSGNKLKNVVKRVAALYFNEIEMRSDLINEMRKGFEFNIFSNAIRAITEISIKNINQYFIATNQGCKEVVSVVFSFCMNNAVGDEAYKVCMWFHDIINEKQDDVHFCRMLYNFWTGSNYVKSDKLLIHIQKSNDNQRKWITSHSCFNDIELYYYDNMSELVWKNDIMNALLETGNRFENE